MFVHSCVTATTYFTSWFVVDFVSTVPFDRWLPVLFPTTFADAEDIRVVKLVRILRLFRLFKLLKVFRISSKLSKFDINGFLSPSFIRLIKLLARIMFVAHLIACFWFLANDCHPVGDINAPPEDDLVYVECGSHTLMSQYIAAFYWTIATMMAVGYGDISAQSNSERMYAIATQVVGSVAFGFIIATVTIIIETMDPEAAAKKFRRDELGDYLVERGYSRDLQKRAKKHFNHYQANTSAFQELGLVGELSHTLKEVILFESRHVILPKICLFRNGVSDQFITTTMLRLKPMLLAYHQEFGNEGDISEEVYFVTKGRVEGMRMIEIDEEEKDAEEDEENRVTHEPVICSSVSDGYELELANCLHETPMNLRYRAAAVTDLLWLDHASLVVLRSSFPRSIIALQTRARKYENLLKKVVASPVRYIHNTDAKKSEKGADDPDVVAGIKVHDLVLKNQAIVSYKDIEGSIAKSMRNQAARATQSAKKRRGSRDDDQDKGKLPPRKDRPSREARKSMHIGFADLTKQKSILNKINSAHVAKLMRTWKWDADEETLVESEETEEDLWERWLVNPGSTFKLKWDLAIGLLIVISVIIVPFRLGFDVKATPTWNIIDWITDFIFAWDIVLNFRTCVMDDQQVLHTSFSLISNHYVRGWLPIDFMSTIPLDKFLESIVTGNASNLRGLRLIRIIRLVRLAKLMKILTAQSMDATDDIITVSPTITKGLKLLATLVFIGHLFGCFFAYLTIDMVAEYGDTLNQTAFELEGFFDYEHAYNRFVPMNGASSWWVYMDEHPEDLFGRYLAALYWAFTTMTTVGYGDILPTNDKERVYSIFIMIMGATVFGYIVGSVSGLASNPHGVGAREQDRIATFTNYLEEQNIKPALRRLAKEQYTHNRKFISVFDEQSILACFPIMIRKQMVLEAHQSTIRMVSIFNTTATPDASLIMNVMNYLNPAFFSAGQYIYRSSDEGVKAVMFLLDGIAEEVPDVDWETEMKKNADFQDGEGLASASPSIRKLQSFNAAMTPSKEKGGLNKKNLEKLGKQDSVKSRSDSAESADSVDGVDGVMDEGGTKNHGLHRNIIESGKCFGYQCFLHDEHMSDRPLVAYRAFSSCSVMILREADLKNIIERHPVLKNKLQAALKAAIIKQTANDEVLSQQVSKFQKKNSLFAALQTGLKKEVKNGNLAMAIDRGTTVETVVVEKRNDMWSKRQAKDNEALAMLEVQEIGEGEAEGGE